MLTSIHVFITDPPTEMDATNFMVNKPPYEGMLANGNWQAPSPPSEQLCPTPSTLPDQAALLAWNLGIHAGQSYTAMMEEDKESGELSPTTNNPSPGTPPRTNPFSTLSILGRNNTPSANHYNEDWRTVTPGDRPFHRSVSPPTRSPTRLALRSSSPPAPRTQPTSPHTSDPTNPITGPPTTTSTLVTTHSPSLPDHVAGAFPPPPPLDECVTPNQPMVPMGGLFTPNTLTPFATPLSTSTPPPASGGAPQATAPTSEAVGHPTSTTVNADPTSVYQYGVSNTNTIPDYLTIYASMMGGSINPFNYPIGWEPYVQKHPQVVTTGLPTDPAILQAIQALNDSLRQTTEELRESRNTNRNNTNSPARWRNAPERSDPRSGPLRLARDAARQALASRRPAQHSYSHSIHTSSRDRCERSHFTTDREERRGAHSSQPRGGAQHHSGTQDRSQNRSGAQTNDQQQNNGTQPPRWLPLPPKYCRDHKKKKGN